MSVLEAFSTSRGFNHSLLVLENKSTSSIMSTSSPEYTPESFLAAICILGFIICIGSFGNGVVMYVYARKNDTFTATLFILSLSIVDFVTCTLIIPMTIAMEAISFYTSSSLFCKIYYILNTSGIPFSSLLLSAIALDRYFCICHPFLRLMTIRRAKVIICLLASTSLFMGVLVGLLCVRIASIDELNLLTAASKNQTNSDMTKMNKTDGRYTCIETSKYMKLGGQAPMWEQILYNVIQKVHITCFILCIVLVIFLYILIYRSVLAMRKKRRQLKGTKVYLSSSIAKTQSVPLQQQQQQPLATSSTTTTETIVLYKNAICEEHNEDAEANGNSEKLSIMQVNNSKEESGRKRSLFSKKSIKLGDNESLQNLKTAAMLFVVAIVFIVTFVPAGLMANEIVPFNIIVFYMYYTNNAANPIIYCFMNKSFRQDLCSIFRGNNWNWKQPSSNAQRLRHAK